MKKCIKSFLTALLLCLLFTTLFAFPAAAESWTDPSTGEYYHVINDGSELKSVIEGCISSDKKIHLLLRSWDLDVYDTIIIKNTNHFVFEPDGYYTSTTISSEDDNKPLFFISESAPGTVLDFYTPDHDLNKNSGILIFSDNYKDEGGAILIEGKGSKILGGKFEYCDAHNDDGGAIYVDADNVTIDYSCFSFSYAEGDGGAICVNQDNCKIKNCVFNGCYADGDGGAIYFCSNSDNGYVWDCKFINCHADDGGGIYFGRYADDGYVGKCTFDGCWADDGDCVVGDNDTEIWNCTPDCDGDDDDNYEDCDEGDYRGSIFSSGNVWLIIVVPVIAVVIAAAVLLILKKKKSASVNGAEVEKSDEDE